MLVVRILSLVALVLSVSNAHASITEGLMTSEDLDAYANRIDFLNCAYGMPSKITECNSSTAAARSSALGFRKQQAAGLNASKKAALDAALAALLPKINKQDVDDYMVYFAGLPESKQIDEYGEDAIITYTIMIPGEATMDMAASKDFDNPDANKDVVSQKFEYTKEELRALNGNQEKYDDTGDYTPKDLQGLKTSRELPKQQSLILKNENTLGELTMLSGKDEVGMSLRTKTKVIMLLRRYPELGYAIKISKLDLMMDQKMKKGVFDRSKLPVKNLDIVKVETGKPDYGWINRYSKMEDENRRSRHKDSNFKVLEFGIDRSQSYYDKMQAKMELGNGNSASDDGKRERLIELYKDKAKSFHKSVERQYYIMKFYYGSDPEVKDLLNQYESFEFADIGPMPNDLDKEGDF
ncbi:MAG: hypothetical protein CFH44_00413 [Proteobacteria bacterium]|nr:MAG: hypothetical protein CFH44_00413 [Pseudomonadota bacterium]